MRKLIVLFSLFIIIFSQTFGQTKHICSLDNLEYLKKINIADIDGEESFKNSKEASEFIEKLLKVLDLDIPMNFTISECRAKDCKNNAYAAMDIEGNRHIVYDNQWFKSLESGNQKIESLTILAHELGHHLAAHTLSLNYYNHEDAVKYCRPNSISYDKKICEKQYQNEYLQYLRKSRNQELEADRFSGFIMSMYEIRLPDVLSVFKKFSKEKDDTKSTHPSLKKRLAAIEQGYNLAEEKKGNKNLVIDLQKIKGIIFDFKIKNKTNLQKNKIISEIRTHIGKNSIDYISKNGRNDDIQFSRMSGGKSAKRNKILIDKFIAYHGHQEKPWAVDRKNDYFLYLDNSISILYNSKINYSPLPAIHIKDGILKILIFGETKYPKIVYTCPFDKDIISYKEIESIFIEIYSVGIQRAIEEYDRQ